MAKTGTTKFKSNKQEKDVAKLFKAKRVVASGAFWSAKADVRNSEYLIECKTTGNNYYSLSMNTWEKIEEEAIKDHMRTPLMVIDLENGKHRVIVYRPKDFGEDVEENYFISRKSVRVTTKLKYPFTAVICGNKKNVLCFTSQKDFEERYGE